MCDFMGGFPRQYRSLCATIREDFSYFVGQIGRCKATAGEEKRGVLSLFFTIILFLFCYSVFLSVTNLFPTLFAFYLSLQRVIRQVNSLWCDRLVTFFVSWRALFGDKKSNMIKKAGQFLLSQRRFFSHRTHRSNRTHLRTVLNSQKASGIQSTQSVTAKVGCKVLWNRLT